MGAAGACVLEPATLDPKSALYMTFPSSFPFGELENLPWRGSIHTTETFSTANFPSTPPATRFLCDSESNEILHPEGQKTRWGTEGL